MPERLAKEGFVIAAAGGDTTSSTISVALYHLLANPHMLSRLRTELATAPKPFTWTALEQLPYMTGVVNEALRLTGIASRLPRCAPDRDTRYKDIVIPRGTPVSMTILDVHEDESIFPNGRAFVPERWLVDDPAASARLHRFLVPFAKGTRQCLGMK
jgi:cytochrome P450